ncbi:Proteasome assembly chaperone 2 [Geranomyces variabilis]|uniref:Proteasome assembly chaperone 2 n=1 Tax=Geranomyces variabilis TaxID=109894 RepID=A0AAD5TN77_9FUNG|nr:Proteasome assembly chaperone 2 [Geranomyces variabilis]
MTATDILFHPAAATSAQPQGSAGHHALLAEKTLLLPAPNSIGNLGQLATDVLISSLGLVRIGFLSSELVLPACGTEAYGTAGERSNELHTNFEVYGSPEGASPQIVALQLRAPVTAKRGVQFSTQLFHWIEQAAFASVIVLTGADAGRRMDREIVGNQLCALTSTAPNPLASRLAELGISTLEAPPSGERPIPPPGGGLARFLLNEFDKSSISMMIVACFAADGDCAQAVRLASAVFSILYPGKEQIQWKTPASWAELYGPLQFTKELFQ